MNLRGIANAVSSCVNPNVIVSVQLSNGYTIGAGQRQIPAYKPTITGPAQIQALDNSDLKQMEGLNIQGSIRALYMYGHLAGVVRPDSSGGDLITLPNGSVWLTVRVLESWPDWTKVAIQKQSDVIYTPRVLSSSLVVTAPVSGNFAIAHGLSVTPSSVRILMTSSGSIWQTSPPDATNVYLSASEAGVTANVWVN